MKNQDLLPLFITVAVLNLYLIMCVLVIVYKFYKLKIREFYHRFIVTFLLVAYCSRIVALCYVYFVNGDKGYNRSDNSTTTMLKIIVYAPVTFHGLAGLAYLFRWSSYCVLATAERDITERAVAKKLTIQAIIFFVICTIYLVTYIGMAIIMHGTQLAYKLLLMVLYFGSSIALLCVASYFLKALKLNRHPIYLQKNITIRRYTTIIAVCLMIRGGCEIYDFIMQFELLSKYPGVHLSLSIMMMCCYFTEIIPSFIITFVLWKSSNEKLEISQNNVDVIEHRETECLIIKATNYSSQDQALYATHPTAKDQHSFDYSKDQNTQTLLESVYDSAMYSGEEERVELPHEPMSPLTYY